MSKVVRGAGVAEKLHDLSTVVDVTTRSFVHWRGEALGDVPGAVVKLEDKTVFLLHQVKQDEPGWWRRLFARSFEVRCGSEVFECHASDTFFCDVEILWPTRGRRARLTKALFGRGKLYLEEELVGVWEVANLVKRARRFRDVRGSLELVFEPDPQALGEGRLEVLGSPEGAMDDGCLFLVCAFLLGLIRRW